MHRPKAIFLASLAALGLVLAADRATADDWVEMTSCDQVIVDGLLRPHVQFSVHNGTARMVTW